MDPDNILLNNISQDFRDLLEVHDEVFNPTLSGYNGAAGPFEAVVNMGPVQPPQRKGRLPQYAHNKLVELQQKFDELKAQGRGWSFSRIPKTISLLTSQMVGDCV